MKKTKKELYKWFWNKFDSCYLVEHKNNKSDCFMYYDEKFLRKKKLSRLTGEELIYPEKPDGKVLFRQDWESKRLCCDHDEIWTYFEINYSSNYQEIKELIVWMLKEHDKLSVLTPFFKYWC